MQKGKNVHNQDYTAICVEFCTTDLNNQENRQNQEIVQNQENYVQSRKFIKKACKQKICAKTIIWSKMTSWYNGNKLQYVEIKELGFQQNHIVHFQKGNLFI